LSRLAYNDGYYTTFFEVEVQTDLPDPLHAYEGFALSSARDKRTMATIVRRKRNDSRTTRNRPNEPGAVL